MSSTIVTPAAVPSNVPGRPTNQPSAGLTREILDEVKYQKRFPPHEAAGKERADALGAGPRGGLLVQRVSGIYVEAVEAILEAFSDTVLERSAALGLTDEGGIRAVLAQLTNAHE